MSKDEAVKNHAGAYNCAEAVIKAFDNNEDLLREVSSCGGGRAEGGLCGALYAGLRITTEDKHDALKDFFLEEAKYLTCRDIRKNKTLTCSQCVGRVGEFLESLYAKC